MKIVCVDCGKEHEEVLMYDIVGVGQICYICAAKRLAATGDNCIAECDMSCTGCCRMALKSELFNLRCYDGSRKLICRNLAEKEHLIYSKCPECGDYFFFSSGRRLGDGRTVCSECADGLVSSGRMKYCEWCDKLYPAEELEEHDGHSYCRDCAVEGKALDRCERCGRLHSKQEDGSLTIYDGNGDAVMQVCKMCSENYRVCDICGHLVDEDVEMELNGDLVVCPKCAAERREEAGKIKAYIYNPNLVFHSVEGVYPYGCYLGFELEAGGTSYEEAHKAAADIYEEEQHFWVHRDSSIPNYGFELTTMPMTLAYHHAYPWWEVFRKMDRHGLKSHDSFRDNLPACGLHVHISRDYSHDPGVWRNAEWFMLTNRKKFEKLARRKGCHYAEYIEREYGKCGTAAGERYKVMNFENRDTVEFRLWRGTLKYRTVMATLEMTEALVKFFIDNAARFKSPDDFSDSTFEEWFRYVCSKPEYSNAAKYMSDRLGLEIPEEAVPEAAESVSESAE